VNPTRLRQRAAITRAIRQWFDEHGYLEVHTPVLVQFPALEEHLEPVKVGNAYLHTSPEFAMKRVLGAGLCRVYQIVPCFREEEIGRHHAREFTMIEWYRANAGTADLMDDVESLIASAADAIKIPPPHFTRLSVADLRLRAGLDDTDDEVEWFQGWVDAVEPRLTDPTIVHSYPSWQAALATERNGLADRFEVYLGGVEIGNCFAEEGDPHVLRSRFSASAHKRTAMGKEPHAIDQGLIEATSRMPRTSGIAVGLDRLVMALTGTTDISEVQIQ
jgi:lysyl-tRNA synthetase class 2